MNQSVKTALIIGGIVLAILIILPLVFGLVSGWQGYGYGMMGPGMMGMMGPWMMGGFGGMWLGPILWIVITGLIIWAVVAAVRRPGESDSPSRQADSVLEILKRRYAQGDISREEFEEKKRELS